MTHTASNLLAGLDELKAEEIATLRERCHKRIWLYAEGWHCASCCAEYFDHITRWAIHRGDLTVRSDLDVDTPLVVDGNLDVHGTYTDGWDYNDEGHLICLGNLTAKNVFTRNVFFVSGSLSAAGFIFAEGNDYPLEIGDGELVKARWVSMSERCCYPNRMRFEEVEFLDLDCEARGDPEAVLAPQLLSFVDDNGDEVDPSEVCALRHAGEKILAVARPDWRDLFALCEKGLVFNVR